MAVTKGKTWNAASASIENLHHVTFQSFCSRTLLQLHLSLVLIVVEPIGKLRFEVCAIGKNSTVGVRMLLMNVTCRKLETIGAEWIPCLSLFLILSVLCLSFLVSLRFRLCFLFKSIILLFSVFAFLSSLIFESVCLWDFSAFSITQIAILSFSHILSPCLFLSLYPYRSFCLIFFLLFKCLF